MDTLKELHASLEKAWGLSFDAAYRDLETKLLTQEATLKKANENASAANEARQAAEHRIQELQQEVLALQDAFQDAIVCHESSLEERAIPMPFANLEDEFAPKYVWSNGLQDGDKLPKILEKYSALYTNMQTLAEGWVDLKRKVLRHRDKLRHWEKQLQRNEFTLVLHGAPVTFRRVHTVDTGRNASKPMTLASSSVEQPLSQHPKSPEGPRVVAKPARPAQNDESTGSGPRIKTEPNSEYMAHPISNFPPSLHREHSKSSSDTPQPLPDLQGRKRKRVQQTSHAHPIAESPRGPALVKNESISSSPVQDPLLSTQDLDDIGATVQTPTKRRAVHRESLAPGFATSHATVRRSTLDQFTPNAPPLQPIDGNTSTFQLAEQKRRSRATNDRAALSMAEDGDTDGGYDEESPKHTSGSTPALHAAPPRKGIYDTKATESRLQSLLEASTPSKSLLGTSKARNGGNQPRGLGTVEPPPVQHPLQPNDAGPEVRPEDEPYRLRPLHCLSLDHFKVNPGRNQGVDFAYDSVIRKKDERKCLSGCTRPGCCGDHFRVMARLGGLSANSPGEQAEEDQRVLEEYVGDDRQKLKRLSAHDRENLLVDARARVLANQYGRHRHSYQRAPSPPGFWRTDMPSTQEMESDREAAQRQEREKVEERYREAMRPGGLWTFADE